MAAWVRRKDRHNRFITSPYQETPSPPMTPELYAACEEEVHVFASDGTVLRAGRAWLFILERIGWGWFARLLTLPPFIWVVGAVYRLVANNRQFFGRVLFTREYDESPGARHRNPEDG